LAALSGVEEIISLGLKSESDCPKERKEERAFSHKQNST
jgi:hypothetical protein